MAVPRAWVGAVAIGALSAAAVAVAGPASAGASPIAHLRPHGVLNYQPTLHLSASGTAASTAGSTLPGGLPVFTAHQTDPVSGQVYHYTMVGKNPKVAQTSPSTTVKTKLIPLKIVLSDGTAHNPAKTNSCDTASPLTRTADSPIFVKQDWNFQGTDVGTSQYVDAFRRAEFWQYTQPSGINPGYHVKLALTQLPVVTVHVPAKASATAPASCATEIGLKIQWLNNYLVGTLLPQLASEKLISPKTFPLFLVSNTVEYSRTTANCCILGYHSAFQNKRGNVQTFGIADYENSGFFPSDANLSDVEVLSHEVAEWMDDPLGNNATPAWGNIGQVSGCQANLEVGDPLTGSTIPDTVGSFTYNVQELAFTSWFYHQSPSTGVNGLYSNNGTFTSPAAPCS